MNQRLENSPFAMKNSLANVQEPYSDEEPFSKYFPVTFHFTPATRIRDENPALGTLRVKQDPSVIK